MTATAEPPSVPLIRARFPKPRDAASFFGKIQLGPDGLPTDRWLSGLTQIRALPYPMRLAWQPEIGLRRIVCHRAVVASLGNCLRAILELYGSAEAVRDEGLDLFGGGYGFVPGAALSLRCYGAAISFDPSSNPPGKKWKEGMMPREVQAIFKESGWGWGGELDVPECGLFVAATL